MNIQEYLIDPRGKDWRKLRAYWIPLMPDDASLWFVNRLGEIIFASPRGTIHRLVVGSGTVANQDESRGASCLAERRTLETISDGKPTTPFLKFGDTVRIEMLDEQGISIFGAIEQTIRPAAG